MMTFLLAAPFAAALFTLFLADDDHAARRWGVAAGLGILGLALAVLGLEGRGDGPSLTWFHLWGTDAEVSFALAADGLSTWMVHLVALLVPIALLAEALPHGARLRDAVVAVFLLEGSLFGVFLANDLVLFYLCFEAMLLPLLVLVSAFGDHDRRGAATMFFLYTMAGSVLLLVAIWYLAAQAGTTHLPTLIATLPDLAISDRARLACFIGIALAFAVKTPLVPLHSWQARVYSAAPIGVAVLLAGAVAKVGLYGFLRILLPLFPQLAADHAGWFVALALIGIVGGAGIALVQPDLRRLVAFSSLSHLGFMTVAIFVGGPVAHAGVVVQMFAHGLAVAALLLVAAMLERRRESRDLTDLGGLASAHPGLAVLTVATVVVAVAVPGSVAFVGEVLVLIGVAQAESGGLLVAAVIGSSLILGAAYLLRLVQLGILGPATGALQPPRPVTPAEAVTVTVPVALSLFLGCYPGPLLAAGRAQAAALAQTHQPAQVVAAASLEPPALAAVPSGATDAR